MPNCITPGCGKPTTLKCPTCLKFGINSYFCGQECLKSFWKTHKLIHQVSAMETSNKHQASLSSEFVDFDFTGPLRPASKSPIRKTPKHIKKPDYSENGIPHGERQAQSSKLIKVLSEADVQAMRETSKFGREVLDIAIAASKAGVTTEEVDTIVYEACIERNCYPSPLNYYNFPKSCCTSLNEVICHGIPDKRPLEDGDILNIDITTYFNGFHGDLNETIFIGEPSKADIVLVKNAYDCLAAGMDHVAPNIRYRDIGNHVSKVATRDNLSVVRTYCGHGIHNLFHCIPNVPHYAHNNAIGIMKVGHCFTIEPMINVGTWRDRMWPDNWTVVTDDGKKSAQFEHSMIICNPDDPNSCSVQVPDGPPIEVVTKRIITGDDPLENVLKDLSDEDKRHFEMYGRPHFVDQLFHMGKDLSILYSSSTA